MFERFTEKARRTVFFARYEACQFGSPAIDTEHMLLGLLREEKSLQKWIPKANGETIRKRIESSAPKNEKISTSIDLPLSHGAKGVLHRAMTEADRLNHKHIGTEHLFLGLAGDHSTVAGKLLLEYGADSVKLRLALERQPPPESTRKTESRFGRSRIFVRDTVEIHGGRHHADYVRDVVTTVRAYNWHWQKAVWKPRDIVVHSKTSKLSFDVNLAKGSQDFTLVKNGWKKDHCFICNWELRESDDEHGTGYTNGRTWLCMECCERFVLRDYFSSSQSEMT